MIVALVPLIIAQHNVKAAEPPVTNPAPAQTQPHSDTTAFPINPRTNERATLETRLPELNFDGVALGDVVDFLRDVTNANIFIDWKALEAAGVSQKSPITLRVRDVSFAKALELVLASASDVNPKLGYTLDDNVIRVGIAKPQAATTQPALSPQTVSEIRQKLLAEELENDLKELSRQKSMRDQLQAKFGPNRAGGRGAQKVDRLTKRIAELTGRTESSDPFAVDPQTKAQLDQKLPEVNFDAVPFADVIDFLRDVTKANIFVNWKRGIGRDR